MADGIATTLSLKRRDVTKVMGALAELGSKEVKSVGAPKIQLPSSLRTPPRGGARGQWDSPILISESRWRERKLWLRVKQGTLRDLPCYAWARVLRRTRLPRGLRCGREFCQSYPGDGFIISSVASEAGDGAEVAQRLRVDGSSIGLPRGWRERRCGREFCYGNADREARAANVAVHTGCRRWEASWTKSAELWAAAAWLRRGGVGNLSWLVSTDAAHGAHVAGWAAESWTDPGGEKRRVLSNEGGANVIKRGGQFITRTIDTKGHEGPYQPLAHARGK
jgi:hypothetical protein